MQCGRAACRLSVPGRQLGPAPCPVAALRRRRHLSPEGLRLPCRIATVAATCADLLARLELAQLRGELLRLWMVASASNRNGVWAAQRYVTGAMFALSISTFFLLRKNARPAGGGALSASLTSPRSPQPTAHSPQTIQAVSSITAENIGGKHLILHSIHSKRANAKRRHGTGKSSCPLPHRWQPGKAVFVQRVRIQGSADVSGNVGACHRQPPAQPPWAHQAPNTRCVKACVRCAAWRYSASVCATSSATVCTACTPEVLCPALQMSFQR